MAELERRSARTAPRFDGLTDDSATTVAACMADACSAGAPVGTEALLAQLDACVIELFDE